MNLKIYIHILEIILLFLMELEMNKSNNYKIIYKINNRSSPLYNNNFYNNELSYLYIIIIVNNFLN